MPVSGQQMNPPVYAAAPDPALVYQTFLAAIAATDKNKDEVN